MSIKGAQQVLVESFNTAAAIPQYVAVVQGASDYTCALPGAANAAGFLGFTLDSTDGSQTETIPVVMIGTAWVQAAGAITAGTTVVIANASGQVEASTGVATPNIIGTALSTTTTAGDICLVLIQG